MNMNQQLCPTEIGNGSNKKESRQLHGKQRNKTIKKRRHERTREQRQEEDSKKYNMKKLMESMVNDDSDDESGLENYTSLLPPPTLQQNTKLEAPERYNADVTNESSSEHDPSDKDTFVNHNGYALLEQMNKHEGYDNYVPYYTNAGNTQSVDGPKDALLEKLNYMIHLLEEQKEEKTGHVAEELILYSFLGVFVIFIVDSFARVGKYVR